jgi:glycogen debranching enzyme
MAHEPRHSSARHQPTVDFGQFGACRLVFPLAALLPSTIMVDLMADSTAKITDDKKHSLGRPVTTGRVEGGPHHIIAAASLADERTRVLKHADTFAVFDHYGDVKPGGLGEEGLYHDGTRHLSCFVLELEGHRPFFLNSVVRDENDQLTITLTNPDMMCGGDWAPLGTLHIELRKFLWHGALHQQLCVRNHGLEALDASIALHFAADFADIFEVRGMKRIARGEDLPSTLSRDRVVLAYRGLDGVTRRTVFQFSPKPAELTASFARLALVLEPQQHATFQLVIACEREATSRRRLGFHEARAEADADLERYKTRSCHLHTSNEEINRWLQRALSDLHMMTTELPTGPYPYAGVPWFNTPFGRDGIVTALQCLWLRPTLARGVLSFLASTQASQIVREEDAEPGKILHEIRNGEMAATKEMPFGRYYGSVDATPLFVVLAEAYYRRTAHRQFIQALWPNINAALGWIDQYGDRDGDGFVEYHRQSVDGLVHQGWKDSDEAVFHRDGALAEGPTAVCEVQGYVYAALRAGATLAQLLGHHERAVELERRAKALRERFAVDFWCDELSILALALDGNKKPCCVKSSNAGQCLFTGIVDADHARRMVPSLFSREMFSGWGVRTLASDERRYNPMAYHNGCVWPHDNALIALGLARCGFAEPALRIWKGQFEASLHFELNRMPELFCGFGRDSSEGPIPYPVACSPQAWSAASVFLLFQACLGLEIDATESQVRFTRPRLPACCRELRMHDLEVAGAKVDLLLVRHRDDVGVNVLRIEGDVKIVVEK